ncbi:MAG: excinuclease ABC subunit A [Candidatus Vogelbacteria bacterium RIFOXYD1_FULL_51_18]|uniref:UvrABC system protein A n=1 Tax=Candidatus Vogelbacteria bacterium RIFOXYD1_FULL_51_18 TaxID=1802440 RepID=A0A1G2QM34_9BACT|nr:MAG: Excinuclease ABC, subunit A [Parcubacteria group bacterium GW2011_GWC1_51_35]OHA60971.1 MAG: excinuclease ABC subunit A [Candidatus Vogelbacteria bacterium RIFOXYD1_FULL_51_18]
MSKAGRFIAMPKDNTEKITIRGARTHNLKNITLEIPRGTLTVFTGLSGSGKSSLAFDTIFAEGQRRYVESLSAYARQFLHQMQKPDVDEITGLSPAISIDQKSRSNNPRSTVATITEIYDYLRVLFARVGKPHCLTCGRPIERLSNEEIIALIKESMGKERETLRIYAPLVRGRKGEYYQLLYDLLDKGYREVLVDGKRKNLRERIVLGRYTSHTIDVLVDELVPEDWKLDRKGADERLAEAVERALAEADGLVRIMGKEKDTVFSSKFACPYDGFSYPELEPRLFSFNSPYGACPTCNGLGTKHLFGTDPCEVCGGARLRPEALKVLIHGKNIVQLSSLSIQEARAFFKNLKLTATEQVIAAVVLKEIESRLQFIENVGLGYIALSRRAHTLSGGEAQRIRLASQLGSRLTGTLYVLDEPTIGLHAHDNDRLIKTLEELRDLGNTIIVVEHDEDTILASDYLVDIGPGAGVHGGYVVAAGETDKLLKQKKGTIDSLTLAYLRGERSIEVPKKRRSAEQGTLQVIGATIHNLNNQNIEIPLGRIVAITGVSGSGKSTLLYDVLHENLSARFDRRYRSNKIFNCAKFLGAEYLSRYVLVDQSPIGRTPRSNPATYTGAFSHIRELFAATELARVRGWGPGRFSFNVRGGRCEACQGNGMVAVEMHFLPTVYVPCGVCAGRRFQKETLEVRFQKKNIYEVLEMTVEEAQKFFKNIPVVNDRLQTLLDVGLGYLKLGQSATTLSGGEAQRMKIASELYRPLTTRTIYLLDEPTVGLHYEDVRHLLAILDKLIARGNSVVIIEHNMEVIKCADWVIDMGPEGGDGGGKVVAKGTPEDIANHSTSYTGEYLRYSLKKK